MQSVLALEGFCATMLFGLGIGENRRVSCLWPRSIRDKLYWPNYDIKKWGGGDRASENNYKLSYDIESSPLIKRFEEKQPFLSRTP